MKHPIRNNFFWGRMGKPELNLDPIKTEEFRMADINIKDRTQYASFEFPMPSEIMGVPINYGELDKQATEKYCPPALQAVEEPALAYNDYDRPFTIRYGFTTFETCCMCGGSKKSPLDSGYCRSCHGVGGRYVTRY